MQISNRLFQLRETKQKLEDIRYALYEDTKQYVSSRLPKFSEALSLIREIRGDDCLNEQINTDFDGIHKATESSARDDIGAQYCFVVYRDIAFTEDGKIVKMNNKHSLYDDVGIAVIKNYSEDDLYAFRTSVNGLCDWITNLLDAVDKFITATDIRLENANRHVFGVMLQEPEEDVIDVSVVNDDTSENDDSDDSQFVEDVSSDEENIDTDIEESEESEESEEATDSDTSVDDIAADFDDNEINSDEVSEDESIDESYGDEEVSDIELTSDDEPMEDLPLDDDVDGMLVEDEVSPEPITEEPDDAIDMYDDVETPSAIDEAEQEDLAESVEDVPQDTVVEDCHITIENETETSATVILEAKFMPGARKWDPYVEMHLPYNGAKLIVSGISGRVCNFNDDGTISVNLMSSVHYRLKWPNGDGEPVTMQKFLDVIRNNFA